MRSLYSMEHICGLYNVHFVVHCTVCRVHSCFAYTVNILFGEIYFLSPTVKFQCVRRFQISYFVFYCWVLMLLFQFQFQSKLLSKKHIYSAHLSNGLFVSVGRRGGGRRVRGGGKPTKGEQMMIRICEI